MIRLPTPSIVVLVGPSAAGKSTWASRAPAEVVSSDALRLEHPGEDNAAVFARVHERVRDLAVEGRPTIVDATNLGSGDRSDYRRIATAHGMWAVAVMFPVDVEELLERNRTRERPVPEEAILRQAAAMARVSKKRLRREGWDRVVIADDEVRWTPTPPLAHARAAGPFDIVGDVRGCEDDLDRLLEALGYDERLVHADGRTLVFVGGLSGVGEGSPRVVERVSEAAEAGTCLVVRGKEETFLHRALGRLRVGAPIRNSTAEMIPERSREGTARWLAGLPTHLVLADGDLLVVHAAMRDDLVGRVGDRVEQIAVFGSERVGEERIEWTSDYGGPPAVHGSVGGEAVWRGRTLSIDGGAGLGGELRAYRFPEGDVVAVPSADRSAPETVAAIDGPPPPPPLPETLPADTARFSRRRRYETAFGPIAVGPAKAGAGIASALLADADVPYVAPTISPVRTSPTGDLERPETGIAEYRERGCERVCLEAKHMGSRLVVAVDGDRVEAWTRSGRRLREELLDVLAPSLVEAVASSSVSGCRVVLDGELLPWSALADGLMHETFYAAADAASALGNAIGRPDLVESGRALRRQIERYADGPLSYAPFAVLAVDAEPRLGEPLEYHHRLVDELSASEAIVATERRWVDDAASEAEAVRWWEAYCDEGGEGAVIKPETPPTARRWWPPMLKCRGREYLRLVYGVEYLRPDRLEAARGRSLSRKRAIQRDEYALAAEILAARCAGRDAVDEIVAFFGIDAEAIDTRL